MVCMYACCGLSSAKAQCSKHPANMTVWWRTATTGEREAYQCAVVVSCVAQPAQEQQATHAKHNYVRDSRSKPNGADIARSQLLQPPLLRIQLFCHVNICRRANGGQRQTCVVNDTLVYNVDEVAVVELLLNAGDPSVRKRCAGAPQPRPAQRGQKQRQCVALCKPIEVACGERRNQATACTAIVSDARLRTGNCNERLANSSFVITTLAGSLQNAKSASSTSLSPCPLSPPGA